MRPYRIEVLKKQDRSDFDCGVNTLNKYLKQQAGQEQRKRFSVCYQVNISLTRVFCAFRGKCRIGEPNRIRNWRASYKFEESAGLRMGRRCERFQPSGWDERAK